MFASFYEQEIVSGTLAEEAELFMLQYNFHINAQIQLIDAEGELIAESEKFLYIARKAEQVQGSEIYAQCFALIDKTIANIRPGTVYPAFADFENQLIIEQMRQAAVQYAYVTRGGDIPDEPVEFFMKEDMQYRYMGDDLATKQQLTNFLSSSYTAEATRSYIEHAKLIEENGWRISSEAGTF